MTLQDARHRKDVILERRREAERVFRAEAGRIPGLKFADPWVSDGHFRMRRTLWVERGGLDIVVLEVEFRVDAAEVQGVRLHTVR